MLRCWGRKAADVDVGAVGGIGISAEAMTGLLMVRQLLDMEAVSKNEEEGSQELCESS